MQMMLPTYEITPTIYQRKIKDKNGDYTGETEPVVQFKQYMPVEYTLNISPQAKNKDEILQKLILAADNGDTVKVQGTSEVKTFKNGSMNLFEAVNCEYTIPPSNSKTIK